MVKVQSMHLGKEREKERTKEKEERAKAQKEKEEKEREKEKEKAEKEISLLVQPSSHGWLDVQQESWGESQGQE